MMLKILLVILTQHLYISIGNSLIRVHTQYGDVLGYQSNSARIFYGIPYAQAPIGVNRWQPPIPISPWEPNIINGSQPPAACIQTSSNNMIMDNPSLISEDCLYLNIFTPILNSSSSITLPVMVFIHGGGFAAGYASDPSFESEHLVNTTNIVMVLIQYRLGALGFLATSNAGSNDLKGNYGILDQRLAIAWIKKNINSFGGNSDEITIFGQSAGAQSTALHYLSSDMQTYFKRAIVESAPVTIPFRTYPEYITLSVLFAEQLNCTINDLVCLRSRSEIDVLNAQNKVNTLITSLNPLFYFESWLPVVDGLIIPGNLLEMINNVSFPLKPLILGTVTEECYDFIYGSTWGKPITTSDYIAIILGLFPEEAIKILEKYPPDSSGDQRALVSRICTRWVFSCSTRIFARKAATYSYVFGYPYDRITLNSSSLRCPNHACHADELPYVFESQWNQFTAAGQQVSKSMGTYWTNFATSETPNQPSTTSLEWPKFSKANNESFVFIQDPLSIDSDYLKDDCDFWDEIGYKMIHY